MAKEPLQEHQSVRITRAVKTAFVGAGSDALILPAGTTGAITAVMDDPRNPRAYRIEVYLEERGEFAVANVPAQFVEPCRVIDLDARDWRTALDFYDAILAALGAPEWHRQSPDALVDSMIWGGINRVAPPYAVKITGIGQAPKSVRDGVERAKWAVEDGRERYQSQEGRLVAVFMDILS